MTTHIINRPGLQQSEAENHASVIYTCQDCGELDEFLLTFEARTIPVRWLCSNCYWKQVTNYTNGQKN